MSTAADTIQESVSEYKEILKNAIKSHDAGFFHNL